MLHVKNKKIIQKLSARILASRRGKNLISVLAIMLTAVMFTSIFTIGGSMVKSSRENTMFQVGTKKHAGLERITWEQYEKVKKDTKIQDISYNIFVGSAVNPQLKNMSVEVRYKEAEDAKTTFCYPTEGRMPEKEDEVAMSTVILDAFGLPHKTGETLELTLNVHNEEIKKTFTVCGLWEGNKALMAQTLLVSREFSDEVAPVETVPFAQNEQAAQTDYSGYMDVGFNFSSSWNLQKQADEFMERIGFDPDEVHCGVNWAYETSDIDPMSLVTLIGMALLIMLSGYLIIYNIFYINIFNDIRFYGLLKTIGTTGKQLKKIVRKQAWRLCILGIPAGLILGWLAGRILSPIMMSILSQEIDLYSVNPLIFVGATVFTVLTVHISCIKPCRTAAKVSPIEAVKYTERQTGRRARKTKRTKKASMPAMASANLGRNKKKLVLVVLSLSLSLILLNSVYTIVTGFDMEKYMRSLILSDYMVTDSSMITYTGYRNTNGVTQEFLEELKKQEVTDTASIYTTYSWHEFTEEEWKSIDQILENPAYTDDFSGKWEKEEIKNMRERGGMGADLYGVDENMAARLQMKEGELDWEKFNTGQYILINEYTGNIGDPADQGGEGMPFMSPGQKVKVEFPDETFKEYEVLAIAEIPSAVGTQGYSIPFSINFILPEEELLAHTPGLQPMRTIFNAKEGSEAAVTEWLQGYCDMPGSTLAYKTKADYMSEFANLKWVYTFAGGILSLVLGIIGILNFVNVMVTSVLSRKQELAMMESIGMTGKQQRRMLRFEGMGYAVFTILISCTAGIGVGYYLVQAVAGQMWMFTWHFTLLPIVICIPVLLSLTWLVPEIAYRNLRKRTVVERLHISDN